MFPCSSDTSVLIAMGKVGANYLPVGCRSGGCGVCKIRVLEGEYETKAMSRAYVSLDEEKSGCALACKVFPRSDLVVEPYTKQTP